MPDRSSDLLTAAAAAVFLVAVAPLAMEDLHWACYPLSAVAGLAFAVRRRWPEVTAVLATAAVAAYVIVERDGGPIFMAAFFAFANLAAVRPKSAAWLPWALGGGLTLGAAQVAADGWSFHIVPVIMLLVGAPKLVADRVEERRLKELAAEQETARRLAEERLRIGRDVHDVVGHGLASITLRAGVAEHVRDPEGAYAALRDIREIGKASLAELSALLSVLRGEQAERAPTPGLDAVPELVDRVRGAGLPVALEVDGEADGVPQIVGTAGYRIVQEALTNVARHAGDGARAHVRLARHDGVVEVEVLDDGRAAPATVVPGGGLTGMRERAAALGGRLEAGRAAKGGFRVWASLPVPR